MSSYGPPDRPGGGGSQDPYHGWQGYAQPQYEEPTVYYDQPTYVQPGYRQPAYDQPAYGEPRYDDPGYGWAEPEPPKRISAKLIATIVVVLTVLLAGAGVGYYLTRDDDKSAASPPATSATPSVGTQTDTEQAGQTGESGQDGQSKKTVSPAPEASAEARFADAGQCLVNDGTEDKPRMRIADCAPGTYEVLARFDGTVDYKARCGKVTDYQFYYYFNAELDDLDFVLCLKRR